MGRTVKIKASLLSPPRNYKGQIIGRKFSLHSQAGKSKASSHCTKVALTPKGKNIIQPRKHEGHVHPIYETTYNGKLIVLREDTGIQSLPFSFDLHILLLQLQRHTVQLRLNEDHRIYLDTEDGNLIDKGHSNYSMKHIQRTKDTSDLIQVYAKDPNYLSGYEDNIALRYKNYLNKKFGNLELITNMYNEVFTHPHSEEQSICLNNYLCSLSQNAKDRSTHMHDITNVTPYSDKSTAKAVVLQNTFAMLSLDSDEENDSPTPGSPMTTHFENQSKSSALFSETLSPASKAATMTLASKYTMMRDGEDSDDDDMSEPFRGALPF